MEEEEEEMKKKTMVRSVPDGSDNNMFSTGKVLKALAQQT